MSQHEFQGIHPAPTSFFRKYIWSYDHKVIGKQYLFTGFFFLLLGGFMAMLMRWQLAYPNQPIPVIGKLLSFSFAADENGVISPEGFLQLVTLHGTLMVFFVIIPIVVGAFGNFLIPLQIGARDVAFPFLNALSYWIYFAAGLVITASLFAPKGPAMAGWTSYPPLSDVASMAPGSGLGQDLWLIAVFLVGFSSILGGINFLTTVVKLRAPGMTWGRIPLVTWAQIITAVFQTLATPALASATALLMMDKFFGTSFFLPSGLADAGDQLVGTGGGHPLLWQHVFWFYSHPAVYILILPGHGYHFRDHLDFFQKAHFRLFPYGPFHGFHHGARLYRLGSSHVRQRHEPGHGNRLYGDDNARGTSFRREGFQLARHFVAGVASLDHSHVVRAGVRLHVHHRRLERSFHGGHTRGYLHS